MPDFTELDVVMPVFNEGDHVSDAVAHLQIAAAQAGIRTRLIVVDDGSGPADAAKLDVLAQQGEIFLLRQPNSGRFLARSRGLAAARTRYVLLLDARVNLAADALRQLRQELVASEASHQVREVWNFHVQLANTASPWAAFWSGLTKVWWRRYWMNPRPVTINSTNFNSFPKGTGAFFAPRERLLAAVGEFSSSFDNPKLVSDDTGLLRSLAAAPGISLDPAVSCDYFGKDTPRKWSKQCFYRGTTFVDSYLGSVPWFGLLGILAGAGGAVLAGFALLHWHPRVVAGLALAGSAAAGGAVKACGGTRGEACAVGALTLPFGIIFGSGFLRGLAMGCCAGYRKQSRREATATFTSQSSDPTVLQGE